VAKLVVALGLTIAIPALFDLIAEFAPIAGRTPAGIVPDGDTVFYEAGLDTLLPDEGFNLANDFDVLYVTDFGLTAGMRHSFVRPVYEAKHYTPGEDVHYGGNRHHRLGALLAYTFYDHGSSRFNRPSVILITSWYLDHRWRTGEDVSNGVPYVVLGFAFQSDFLDYN